MGQVKISLQEDTDQQLDQMAAATKVAKAALAAAPSAWTLEGLPWTWRRTRDISSATSGRTGVVAL